MPTFRVEVLKVQELGETRWPEHKKPQTLASDGVTEVGPKTETPILTKVCQNRPSAGKDQRTGASRN